MLYQKPRTLGKDIKDRGALPQSKRELPDTHCAGFYSTKEKPTNYMRVICKVAVAILTYMIWQVQSQLYFNRQLQMLLKEFIKDCTKSSRNNGTYNNSELWQRAWSLGEHYCSTPQIRTKPGAVPTLQASPVVISYSCTSVRQYRKENTKKKVIQ